MSFRKIILYVGMASILFITACGGPTAEEEIYNHLEEAVKLESSFAEEQNAITDLEKEEREIFEQIVDLEMEEFDKIKELSKEALSKIEERSKHIEKEKESIDASKAEFEKIKEPIEELEEDALQKKANELYEVMTERYQSYDNIHVAYVQSLKEEEALYQLFQNEDATQELFVEQTTKVNESYELIIEENDTFNNATSKYNDLKKEFYEQANLNVTYDKE